MKISIKGHDVLIDDVDKALLQGCSAWIDDKGYVAICTHNKPTRLHRLIVNATAGQIVDHANQNKLDNRRANLRITDRCGNARNSKHRRHNTSGFRGVYFCKQTRRWRAEIRVKGRGVKLGRFATAQAAALAYDQAALRLHGEFAVTNFVDRNDPGAIGPGCGE